MAVSVQEPVPAGPFRFARSPAESPSYVPDWRALQAGQYLGLAARGQGGIPPWEDDQLVLDFLVYQQTGVCGNPARERAFAYAREAHARNPVHGMGSRLRALCLAGVAPERIAVRLGTTPLHVLTFLALYWDVAPCLTSRDLTSALVFPHVIPREDSDAARKERLWLAAAYLFGEKGLDRLMLRPLDPSAAQLEETNQLIRAVLAEDGLHFLLAQHTQALPHYRDFERYAAISAIPPTADNQAQESTNRFAAALVQTLAQNAQGLPANHATRVLIETAHPEVRPAGASGATRRAVRPIPLTVEGAWSQGRPRLPSSRSSLPSLPARRRVL